MSTPPLHILILGPSLFEGMAGTRRLQNNLLPMLVKGARISNLLFSGKITKGNDATDQVKALKINYNIYNPISIISFFRAGKRFLKSTYRPNEKNILYVYGYPTIKNIKFIRFARKIGYKVVFDIVEDNNASTGFKSLLSYFKNKTSLYYLRKIGKLCDGCIVISNHLLDMVKQYAGSKPLIKIPISVRIEDFQAPVQKEKPNDTIKLFYGGSFGPKDGLNVLLKALKKVVKQESNIRLVLTGKGAQRHMVQFYASLHELDITDYVDYRGYLSNEEYNQTLMETDICCMTRVNTAFANAGFPFKLGEMLATGKSVIATRVGEVETYLDEESAVLISPDDTDKLADAILFLIKNEKKASQIGLKGREKASLYFNATTTADSLFSFLIKQIR